MHEVSKAINNLDPNKDTDGKICKKGAYNFGSQSNAGHELTGKCGVAGSSNQPSNSSTGGLSLLFMPGSSGTGTDGGNYHNNQTEKMGPITSGVISKDVSALNREQHGVVSSAFTKAVYSGNNTDAARYTSSMYIYLSKERRW